MGGEGPSNAASKKSISQRQYHLLNIKDLSHFSRWSLFDEFNRADSQGMIHKEPTMCHYWQVAHGTPSIRQATGGSLDPPIHFANLQVFEISPSKWLLSVTAIVQHDIL